MMMIVLFAGLVQDGAEIKIYKGTRRSDAVVFAYGKVSCALFHSVPHCRRTWVYWSV